MKTKIIKDRNPDGVESNASGDRPTFKEFDWQKIAQEHLSKGESAHTPIKMDSSWASIIDTCLAPHGCNAFGGGSEIVKRYNDAPETAAERDKFRKALQEIMDLAPRDKLRLPYAIQVVEIAEQALKESQ